LPPLLRCRAAAARAAPRESGDQVLHLAACNALGERYEDRLGLVVGDAGVVGDELQEAARRERLRPRSRLQPGAVVPRQLRGQVVELAPADRLPQHREHRVGVAFRGGHVDALAVGHATDELVDVEALRIGWGGDPWGQLVGQFLRQVPRLSGGDALRERLQGRLLGARSRPTPRFCSTSVTNCS
jgi:hypothetical protein